MRQARRAYCFFAFASAALAAVTAAVWLASGVHGQLRIETPRVAVAVSQNKLYVEAHKGTGNGGDILMYFDFAAKWYDPPILRRVEAGCWYAEIPLAWAICAFGLVAVWSARRNRRPMPGYCRCGYNLHGNTSGRCPECGTKVAGRGSAAGDLV